MKEVQIMRQKFFVLVPVYKVEKYIHDCIRSVLNQSYPEFELIIVDDGSPDRCGEICDEYAKSDVRVHVIHKENGGLLAARRTAIDYVKQNYETNEAFFVFLDSDDSLKPHALQTLAATIEKEPCDMVVYGLERVKNGKPVCLHDPSPYVGTITEKRELYKRMFSNTKYNSLCRKAIKGTLIQMLDYSAFEHVSNGEDLLQDIPIYKACTSVTFIPDVLYNYTINENSMTQVLTIEKYDTSSVVRTEVWKFLQQENVFTEEDYKEYLTFCRRELKIMIQIIGQYRTSRSKIGTEFDKIKADKYYRMLLDDGRSEKLFAWLMCGAYGKIIRYARIKKVLVAIYKKIRGY